MRTTDGYEMKRKFIIIAHARSGSTLLCQKLDAVTDARVYLEIFHQNMQVIEHHLGSSKHEVLHRYRPLEGQELRQKLTEEPLSLLDYLAELNPDQDIFCKIFPDHLKVEKLRQVIGESSGIISLQRNLLHSHLSNQIAQATNRWTNVDTSQHLVEFVPKDFIRHINHVAGFYEHAEACARKAGIPFIELAYETVASEGHSQPTLQKVLDKLGISKQYTADPESPLKRQDKRKLASDKVSNPEMLLQALQELRLAEINDGQIPFTIKMVKDRLCLSVPN